ncbi:hypothetical protein HanIR_Chr02g0081191 [Helianthus annuus]|nr:hypothetical protein HanIR_Chr02g0081191 [Helianthus annuus]
MFYPRCLRMILDTKYPKLVKSSNLLNLKPIGASCFDTVKSSREFAKKHQFLGKYPLEKFWKFGPVKGRVPAPIPLKAIVAEEHDVQFVGVRVKLEIETENLVTDDEATESETKLMESVQAKKPVKELPVMNVENLASLIESLKESLGNPPPMVFNTQEEQGEGDATEDTNLVSRKRQRVDPESKTAYSVTLFLKPSLLFKPNL